MTIPFTVDRLRIDILEEMKDKNNLTRFPVSIYVNENGPHIKLYGTVSEHDHMPDVEPQPEWDEQYAVFFEFLRNRLPQSPGNPGWFSYQEMLDLLDEVERVMPL